LIKPIWKGVKIGWIAARRLYKEHYTYHASALAFVTLLTIVPLLTVVLSIISIFPIFAKYVGLAQSYIMLNFIPTSSGVIQHYLESFIRQATTMSKMGILILFITTTLQIVTIENAINHIWQGSDKRKRYFSWLVYWLMLLIAPIFIGLSIVISSYLFSISWFSKAVTYLAIKSLLISAVPIVINTVMFSLFYAAIPSVRVKWRDAFFGGLIAAILFEMSKIGFAFYIIKFPSYALIYGALATVPIFLIWIYLVWLIVLYGALITHERQQLR